MGSQCLLAGSARCTHINTNMGDNPEIWKAAAMQDHFEKIQKLPDKVDGVPNFRRVPGYKVYCCGQPTIEGFTNALNKACGDIYPKTNKIIWLNMRQEPKRHIVVVGGEETFLPGQEVIVVSPTLGVQLAPLPLAPLHVRVHPHHLLLQHPVHLLVAPLRLLLLLLVPTPPHPQHLVPSLGSRRQDLVK